MYEIKLRRDWDFLFPNPVSEALYDNMWKLPFSGGNYMSRFILNNPKTVDGKTVMDIGTGCGIIAISAALAGAKHIIACDMDETALKVMHANAKLNGVGDQISSRLLVINNETIPPADVDIVTAADVFYKDDANVVENFLLLAIENGKGVLAASFDSELDALRPLGINRSQWPSPRQPNLYVRMVEIAPAPKP